MAAGIHEACEIVAESPVMTNVLTVLDEVAGNDCPVLLEGDAGTGKKLLARRLHERSPRAAQPFVPVDCADLRLADGAAQLLGRELATLGVIRCADQGTLYVANVNELSLDLQLQLAHLLREKRLTPVGGSSAVGVDVRCVVTTRCDLLEDVQRRALHTDLYECLNRVHIYVPPLRARPDDILPLLDHFLVTYARRFARPIVRIGGIVREQLRAYAWPGNVRELAVWVRQLYATGMAPELLVLALATSTSALVSRPRTACLSDVAPGDAERALILKALEATEHNRTRAAEMLRIHRGTLLRKMQRYGIT
ncbi:MAG: sigma 54-interacting transcriptional regulator [Phycisphaerae bacterium]|jgi:DNA-binding NtrC family response regulator